ncbi:MAG TPA: PfkB family carbohydrate kinase, partial [Actinomycetota bacterium]|nr:PfkB family carbohydrate kinase [Actinomycetota bacterium]
MPAGFDLLVLGDAKPDLILTGGAEPMYGAGERLVDGALLTLGGSGGIAACGAARLGLRVAYAGVVGADDLGSFVTSSLAAAGVDTRGVVVDPDRPTGVTVILKRGDEEAVLTQPGTVGALSAPQVSPDLLDGARMVHVSSYFLQVGLRDSVPDLFGRVHRAGASTSVDPNRDPAGEWESGFLDLLSVTDIL